MADDKLLNVRQNSYGQSSQTELAFPTSLTCVWRMAVVSVLGVIVGRLGRIMCQCHGGIGGGRFGSVVTR